MKPDDGYYTNADDDFNDNNAEQTCAASSSCSFVLNSKEYKNRKYKMAKKKHHEKEITSVK